MLRIFRKTVPRDEFEELLFKGWNSFLLTNKHTFLLLSVRASRSNLNVKKAPGARQESIPNSILLMPGPALKHGAHGLVAGALSTVQPLFPKC